MTGVVVTGGWGFIGSHLVEQLVARGDEVIVVDPASPPLDLGLSTADVRQVQADVRDATTLRSVIGEGDTVYHLSSVVGVDSYLDRPVDVIDVMVSGTSAVLAAASAVGARVVLASTSEVFGKNPNGPWAEEDDRVLGPTSTTRWCYSSAKAVAEHLVHAYSAQFGLRSTIIRYFNVYGPRQRPAYVISRTVHRALHGLPPLVYDGGDQTRCFTFVDDAVGGTILAGDAVGDKVETFNIGSEVETSVADAVRFAARAAGYSDDALPVVTMTDLGATYEDIPRRVPDASRIASRLGWTASTSLERGLELTVSWARANRWWMERSDSGALEEAAAAPYQRK